MTSKTSFFNMGIYKSVLKRYSWGALLYFTILFMSTGLSILSGGYYHASDLVYYRENPLILRSSFLGFPLVLAIVVPTITALLVFRFIHSKKQVVFTHSLPVCRKANYISSLLGGFTLMAVPIVLNALSLMLISVCGYGLLYTPADCVTWMWYNLAGIFMMYSCAVFSAVLTGNSFAVIVINILVHAFLFVTAAALSLMAEVFVHGIDVTNAVIDAIAETNFATLTMSMAYNNLSEEISWLRIAEYSVIPLAIYVLSYFIYKHRRSETASDVAGFAALGSVLKYMITFLATVFAFALFAENLGANLTALFVTLVIICAIAYFGSEMLIKKSFAVLGSYKGYICFALLFAALVGVFAFTSFFGYETRIPAKEDIAQASIYNYYYRDEMPYTDDAELIEQILSAHEKITDDIPLTRKRLYDTRLHISYKLKNGDVIKRVYPTTYDQCTEFMNKIYENDEYKMKCEDVFVDDDLIVRVSLNGNESVENKKELMQALRADVRSMSFEELNVYPMIAHTNRGVQIEYEMKGKKDSDGNAVINGMYIELTDKYTNTLNWLKENGYYN